MTIYIHIPYTYLLGWSDHSKYYYGVRYAKDCHPDELWKNYFTSSKHVKAFAAKHGAPDIIQIRRTFSSSDSARLWENKVLKRISAKHRKIFLNHTDNIAIPVCKFNRSKNFETYINSIKGKSYEEIYGKNKSSKLKKQRIESNKKRRITEETRNKMSKSHAGKDIKNRKHAYRKVSCIKCKKNMMFSNYIQWHNH